VELAIIVAVKLVFAAGVALALAATAGAQQPQPVPRPFPRPGEPPAPTEAPSDPVPAQIPPANADAADESAPTEASLGLPIYPAAQYVESFDAGRGQRYYLFGTNADFTEIVAYYKGLLNSRGTLVFDAPPVHMFEVGRFREEMMAFPPGVTVKDYAWNGAEGYLSMKPGAPPVRFRTIIQIVPVPNPASPVR
jgi:hypothetical protein